VVESAATGIEEGPQPRFILGGFVRRRSAMPRASSDNPKSSAVFSFCKVGTELRRKPIIMPQPLPFVLAY
jgi:hypothetical protein